MNLLPHIMIFAVGVILLWMLKRKYKKIRTTEFITILILLFLLVILFTEKGIEGVRNFINLIQID